MFRGLGQLTWLETKIFVREPLGLFGTVGAPVVLFLLGRMVGSRSLRPSPDLPRIVTTDLPVLAAMFITVSAVMSLIAIMAIYREGGILKRLRATPLAPYTILTAHVLVKLLISALTVAALAVAGRRYYPDSADAPFASFGLAVLFCTACVSAMGFVVASVVPTARFAQPIGALVFYPMLGLSGLFSPLAMLPDGVQSVARALPLAHAVSLLRGVWHGDGWAAHGGDVIALLLAAVVSVAVSARVFRWE